MDWQVLLERSLEQDCIRELYLYQIPVLKTCGNWASVQEIGKIEFAGKHANYNGGLVRYGNQIYFITDASISALSVFRKWSFKKRLNVITEKDVEKNKKKLD